MADAPDAEIDFVRFFGRRSGEGGEKCALVLSGDGNLGLRAHAAVLAISNRFGALFAATRDGIRWAWLSDLHAACDHGDTDAAASAFTHLPLDDPPLFLRLNADEESLALLNASAAVNIFDVRALLCKGGDGALRASHNLQCGSRDWLDLQWSPNQPERAAVLGADGMLSLLDMEPGAAPGTAATVREQQLIEDVGLRSICWAAKGQCLWCGHADGTLSRFDTSAAALPPLQQAVRFAFPEGIETPSEVSFVHRLSASHLLLGIDRPLEPNEVHPNFIAVELNTDLDSGSVLPPVAISVHEIATALFPLFRELAETAVGAPLRRRLHAVALPDWRMAVTCSSDSDAVCCLGSRRPGAAQRWQKWTLPDEEGPPSIPTFESGDGFEEQFVAGMALDLTNTERLVAVAGEECFAPSPVVWALTSHGSLIAWTALHKKAPTAASGEYAFMREPEELADGMPIEAAAAGAYEGATVVPELAVECATKAKAAASWPARDATACRAGLGATFLNGQLAPVPAFGSASGAPAGLFGATLLPATAMEPSDFAATTALIAAPASNPFGAVAQNALQAFILPPPPTSPGSHHETIPDRTSFSFGGAGGLFGATATLTPSSEVSAGTDAVATDTTSGAGVASEITSHEKLLPLHAAAKGGDITGIQTMLAQGAGVNTVSKNGVTPLILAPFEGQIDAVKLRLGQGGDAGLRTLAATAAAERAAKAPTAGRPHFDAVLAALGEHAAAGPQAEPQLVERPSPGGSGGLAVPGASATCSCHNGSSTAKPKLNSVYSSVLSAPVAVFEASAPALALSSKLKGLCNRLCGWAMTADPVLRETISCTFETSAKRLSRLDFASASHAVELSAHVPSLATECGGSVVDAGGAGAIVKLRLCKEHMRELRALHEGLGAHLELTDSQRHDVLAPLVRLLQVDKVEPGEVERLCVPLLPEELRALRMQLEQLEGRVERAQTLREAGIDENMVEVGTATPHARLQLQLHATLEEHASVLRRNQARIAEIAWRVERFRAARACIEAEEGCERATDALRTRMCTRTEQFCSSGGSTGNSQRALGGKSREERRRLGLLTQALREREGRADEATRTQAGASLKGRADVSTTLCCVATPCSPRPHRQKQQQMQPTLTAVHLMAANSLSSGSCIATSTSTGGLELPAVPQTPTGLFTIADTKVSPLTMMTSAPAATTAPPSLAGCLLATSNKSASVKPTGASLAPVLAPLATPLRSTVVDDGPSLGAAFAFSAPTAAAGAEGAGVEAKKDVVTHKPSTLSVCHVVAPIPAAVKAPGALDGAKIPPTERPLPSAAPLASKGSAASSPAAATLTAAVMPAAVAMTPAVTVFAVDPNGLALPTASEAAPLRAVMVPAEALASLATFGLGSNETPVELRLKWYKANRPLQHGNGVVLFQMLADAKAVAAPQASASASACEMSASSFLFPASGGSLANALGSCCAAGILGGEQSALDPAVVPTPFGAAPIPCSVAAAPIATPFRAAPSSPFGCGAMTSSFGRGCTSGGVANAIPTFGASPFGAPSQLGGGIPGFGVKPAMMSGLGTGASFGQPSSLGPGVFGQPNAFGHLATSAFSNSPSCGMDAFGNPLRSTVGVFNGSAGTAFSAASTGSGGFSALATQGCGIGFGALAVQGGGFGASTQAFAPRSFGGHRG